MGQAKIRCPECREMVPVEIPEEGTVLVECKKCGFINSENWLLGYWSGYSKAKEEE